MDGGLLRLHLVAAGGDVISRTTTVMDTGDWVNVNVTVSRNQLDFTGPSVIHTCTASKIIDDNTESRGRVVTRWPGSQKVWGSIPVATKIVRCKNLAFNIGECVSRGSETTLSRWSHVYRESHPRSCKRPKGACQ